MEPVPGRGQCLHEIPGPKRLVPEEEDRVAAVLGELPGQRFGVVGIWFMIAAVFIGFSDTLRSYGHARRSRTARARGLA